MIVSTERQENKQRFGLRVNHEDSTRSKNFRGPSIFRGRASGLKLLSSF